MSEDISGRPKPLLLLLVAISRRSVSGLSDDHPGSKDAVIADANPSNSSSNTRREVLFICLGVVGIALLFVFLLKLWEKKKREEQHARLLRLFEEDDELELELGLRD
ncbi:unnamed protein product [Musa acuminata subsp. malaccensis]|uniref:(wild Malaysian banana) hypothetical protein n=1 Tax=Musa acuminata subsp. malaccensis TaxID=214687 RepID=A0A804K487_MUSAM|nr:unnamed protein product [Musa acuminata subsp. malaccensis]